MKTTKHGKLLTLGTAIFTLMAPSIPALAQTPSLRYEHAPNRPHYLPYSDLASSRGGNQDLQTWTSFTFENDEKIHEFRWRGAFLNWGDLHPARVHNPPSASTGSWEVTIWADNDGEPAPVPLVTHILPASQATRGDSRVETFWTGAFTFFEHSFELPIPFEATAGTRYWISPVYLGSTGFPLFLLDSGAAGQVPVPQMSWAEIRRPLGNTLVRFHSRGGRTLSDDTWEYREVQATMKLITVPSNDSDNDGMDDDWEDEHELDSLRDDSLEDGDGDGSNNLDEFARKTDPNDEDSDDDGLLDGVESNTGIFVDASDTGTSPLLADSDRDGLEDAAEVPMLEFTGAEQPGTDPNLRDSDGDGYADGLEIDQGLDPTDENSLPSRIVLDGLIGNDLTDPEDDGTSAGTSASGISFSHDESSYTLASEPLGSFMDLFDGATSGSSSYWRNRAGYRVDVTLQKRHVLESFTLTSGITSRGRDPLAWEIQGSNDGETFETIFHRCHPTQSVWTANSQTVRFDAGVHYVTPPAYSTFRLRLYEYQDQPEFDLVELGELELFGSEAELTVTNTNNEGPGSLRQAIADCPENGLILFDPEIGEDPILLTGDPLSIERTMAIDASALPNGVVLGGTGAFGGLTIAEETAATITRVAIVGGGASVVIRNDGNLALNHVLVEDTGGIRNLGQLTLNDTVIANNFGGCAGGVSNSHEMSAFRSTFVGNGVARCFMGTGGLFGAAITNHGNCFLDHCTITGHENSGGAISNYGTLKVSHSTIADNRAFSIRAAGGITVHLGRAEFSNCIIANNTSTQPSPNLYKAEDAEVHFDGVNLTDDLSGSNLTDVSWFIVADPRLAPLGDYGGPTPTMPLMPGSPAINMHDNPVEAATDQRGFPRLVGSDYDLGAVEYQGDADFGRVFHVDNDGDGVPFGVEQALGTDPYTPDPENPGNLTFPVFNGQGHALLTFGIAADAHPNTVWILERTTDLQTFTEIYRTDGETTVHGDHIASLQDGESLTVTDENPPVGSAFYRFRAGLGSEDQ